MLAALLALRLLAVEPDETSDEAEARRFAELIDAAANRGELDSALRLVDEAQRLYPHHRWHFFRGALLTEKGDCTAAIAEYDAYLAAETDPDNVASAQKGREACEDKVAPPEPDPKPDPPPPEATPRPEEPPVDTPPKPEPWKRNPAAITLLATGLVSVGIGAGLYFEATRRRDAAENAGALQTFDTELTKANRFATAGITTMSIGGALIIAGAIVFTVVATKHRKRPQGLALHF